KRCGGFKEANQSMKSRVPEGSCPAPFTVISPPLLSVASSPNAPGSSLQPRKKKLRLRFIRSAMESLSMLARSLATDTILGCSGFFGHLVRANRCSARWPSTEDSGHYSAPRPNDSFLSTIDGDFGENLRGAHAISP